MARSNPQNGGVEVGVDDSGQDQERGFQLQDVWAVIQMQWHVVAIATGVALVLAIVASVVATREYSATAVIHMSAMAGQEFKTDKVLDLDQYQRWNRHMFVQTQMEVLYSRSLREQVIQKNAELGFEDLSADDAGLAELRRMMELKPKQGTELLEITVTSTDADRSARLANLIAEVYQDRNLDGLRDAARGARKWVDEQLDQWRVRIDEANEDLLAFQRENAMADAEQQVTALAAKTSSLYAAHGEASTQRALHERTVQTYERLVKQERYDDLAKVMGTPLIEALHGDYARALGEHGQLASRYGERHDQRVAKEKEIERIRDALRSEVTRALAADRARLEVLMAREHSLKDEIAAADELLLLAQSRKAQYDKLRVELDRAREFYQQLAQRRGELDLQSQTQLNNIRVIDLARPKHKPVTPNIPLNLALGLAGGLVVGIAIGLLREYVDDTISSPLDVSTYLKVPFLGMIPKIAGVTDEHQLALYSHHQPRSAVAEAMRAIRTVLDLSPNGESRQRLLVTSAVSSEGKTSTVVRLGVAYANLGRRVLMIDADLRRPRLHKVFGMQKDNGLSAVLGGLSIDEAVFETLVPNLFVMPSGPGGERPNELLASRGAQDLLNALDEHYDIIIIDSPPSVLLSDAQLLSRYVDGVIIVAREHAASRMLIRDAIHGLEQVGAEVLGVIVNAVDFGQRRTSYKYYGYGYRYDKYYDDRRGDAAAK